MTEIHLIRNDPHDRSSATDIKNRPSYHREVDIPAKGASAF